MDRVRAKNWYFWLWLSPLLTIPTLVIIWILLPVHKPTWPILGSALWHLILLVPALDKQSPFVRWHGRQSLVLAGVRTAIPLVLGLVWDPLIVLALVPILIIVWFVGTLWGHRQAARGDCSMMRWAGHGEELSALRRAEREADAEEPDQDRLLEIIRYGRDPEERRKALSELERRGMVESL